MGVRTYLIQQSLESLHRKVDQVMATQAELVVQLNAVNAELVKVGTETSNLKAMVADLQTQVANAPVSDDLKAVVDKIAAQVKLIDDMVPDPA